MISDIELKPRESGNLPPEKLAEVMGQIWPEETVKELMNKLGFVEDNNARD